MGGYFMRTLRSQPNARIAGTILLVLFTILSALFVQQSGTIQAASSAYVRVNQVGYVTGQTKQGVLMATGSESGATFSVIDTASGKMVYTAPIGKSLGSWSSTFPNTYSLDFSTVDAK